jgi:hypothetical protein
MTTVVMSLVLHFQKALNKFYAAAHYGVDMGLYAPRCKGMLNGIPSVRGQTY